MNIGKSKDPVTLTKNAVTQVKKLMGNDNQFGVKIGLKKGGCAGMEYTMDMITAADPNDLITNPNVTEECGCGESIKFESIAIK